MGRLIGLLGFTALLLLSSIEGPMLAFPLPNALAQVTSSALYRASMEVSTTSDWTTIHLGDDEEIAASRLQVVSGWEASQLTYATDPGNRLLVQIFKKQYDETRVVVNVTFTLTGIRKGKPVLFFIEKGSAGKTSGSLYNFNTDTRKLVETFEDLVHGSQRNPTQFSAFAEDLMLGGPVDVSPREFPDGLKVVSLLQNYVIGHPVEETVRILKDTSTQIVFRGFFRWSHQDPSWETKLGVILASIKREIPIHFMGAVSLRSFVIGDTWPNGTALSTEEVKQIVFTLPNGTIWTGTETEEPVIDIAKPLARRFVVAWANLQVDAGVDSIFFDEVEYAAMRKIEMGVLRDISQYYDYWKDIVSQVKTYAIAKYGRQVLVTVNQGWVNPVGEKPYMDLWPYQDFISTSFSLTTVKTSQPQDDWQTLRARMTLAYGHQLPIIGFLDWGFSDSPMARYSVLPKDQQVKMLKMLHESALRNDLHFAYPIAGAECYNGEPNNSLEDGTYETIRVLANSLLGKTVEASTIVEATSTTGQAATGIFEMSHDSGRVVGAWTTFYKSGPSRQLAVKFTPPFEVRLVAARVMIPEWVESALLPFKFHVFDGEFKDLTEPVNATPSSYGWTTIDLTSRSLFLKNTFAISVEFPPTAHVWSPHLRVGLDNGPLNNQTYYRETTEIGFDGKSVLWLSSASWCAKYQVCLPGNAMIRVTVSALTGSTTTSQPLLSTETSPNVIAAGVFAVPVVAALALLWRRRRRLKSLVGNNTQRGWKPFAALCLTKPNPFLV